MHGVTEPYSTPYAGEIYSREIGNNVTWDLCKSAVFTEVVEMMVSVIHAREAASSYLNRHEAADSGSFQREERDL